MRKISFVKNAFLIIYFLSSIPAFSIPITLTVTNQNNGTAELRWNSPSPGIATGTMVSRKLQGENWVLITSFLGTQDNYILYDSIFACNDSVSYIIACDGNIYSDSVTALITDKELPRTVEIESVSINRANGNVVLKWQAGASFDTKGYVVYKTQSAITYDTIWGRYTTSFSDSVRSYSDVYRISAFDQCNNFCIMSAARKPFKSFTSYTSCDNKIGISWESADSSLNTTSYHYELFVSMNNGPDSLLLSMGKNITSFYYENLVPSTNYTFYVKAVSNNSGASAVSSASSIQIEERPLPAYFDLINVTAVNNSAVEINFDIDISKPFKSCNIYGLTAGGTSSLITSIAYKDLFSGLNTVICNTNEHTKGNYCFFGLIIDSCGNNEMPTDTFCTVFLEGNLSGNVAYLTWSISPDAKTCDSSIFNVYRIINDSTALIAIVPMNNQYVYDYTDYIIDVNAASSISYIVDDSCSHITSRSNKVNVFEEKYISIYIPTGFYPQGAGKIFKPFFINKSGDEYDFYIYDRWGNEVFHTNKPEEGWNGTKSGQPASPGRYAYYLKIVRNGQTTSERGSVELIH